MIKKAVRERVLVTGAGGVLGKAVIEKLMATGKWDLLLPTSSELNLLDFRKTLDYFEQNDPKVVIHLASKVYGLAGNMKNQWQAVSENSAINHNLFMALAKFPAKKFFFAGTVASYPFPYHEMPLKEVMFWDGNPHNGEFGYAMAKRHAYSYLKILREEIGMNFVYGVFTNLYGEHDRFDIENGHVIPSLISKAHTARREGTVLEVWGDGSAQRDFLHVSDAARAILFCLEQDDNLDLVNISSGQGHTIRHIAQCIAKEAGVKEIRFNSDKPVGIPVRIVDNSLLKQKGFKPVVDIEDGLARTYHWYAEHYEQARR